MDTETRHRRRVLAARTLVAALCLAGALAAGIAYRSDHREAEIKRLALVTVSKADPATRERARVEALELADSAKVLNPGSEVDVQTAVFLMRDRRRSAELLAELTEREPENLFLWLLLTQKRQREGDQAGARRSYARALQLDPRLEPGR